jgi:hypothetical protein
VKIPKNAFLFCRIGVALIAWAALIFKIKSLILLTFLILALSVILKIRKAPMVWIYSNTIERIKGLKSKEVSLDESGMRFAHSLGAIFCGLCVLLLYLNYEYAWLFVSGFVILKTISAIGLCPAEKLYKCMCSGGCCALTRKKKC